jgi:allophanate hydrolase
MTPVTDLTDVPTASAGTALPGAGDLPGETVTIGDVAPAQQAPGPAVCRVLAAFEALDAAGHPEVWTHVRPVADVVAEATEVDARVAAGEQLPLAGTVFGVKDNIDVAGLPTTAAHPAYTRVPARSASVVAQLVGAGAIVLGKTNLDQFATGLTGSRSPYGVVRSAVVPERVSGGSSSGSAVAVGLGIVDFALGTDTAGSGRVPAAFNGLVGIKPTLGLVPKDGVVPACESFDCVTVLAPTLDTARTVLGHMTATSPLDPSSRSWPAGTRLAAPQAARVAVPRDEDLVLLSPESRARFDEARARLESTGATTAPIDLTPFLRAASLLYDGGLVAERYAAYGEFLAGHPEHADPTVARIAAAAGEVTAAEYLAAQSALATYRLEAMALLEGFDALLAPTAPEHPTVAAVAADPLGTNARLGTYTNFVNLFDMAGVAVPAGEADGGLFGVSLLVRAFDDQVALDLAERLLAVGDRSTADGAATVAPSAPYPTTGTSVVVFGAHLTGEPLNDDLVALGARFVGPVATAPDYRMHALATSPAKPLLAAVAPGTGTRLAGEEWLLTPHAVGQLLSTIPRPLALGAVTLDDGREVVGFVGSLPPTGDTPPDVSQHGGWRAYRASLS